MREVGQRFGLTADDPAYGGQLAGGSGQLGGASSAGRGAFCLAPVGGLQEVALEPGEETVLAGGQYVHLPGHFRRVPDLLQPAGEGGDDLPGGLQRRIYRIRLRSVVVHVGRLSRREQNGRMGLSVSGREGVSCGFLTVEWESTAASWP